MKKKRVEFIKNKMEWMRSLSLGESKTGKVRSPKECYSMSVLMSRLNAMESQQKGFRIRGHYDTSLCLVTIYTDAL